jgi:hypothetical protein
MLTLDGAETVLGYFYFDRTLYGNKEYCKENDIGAGTVTAIIQEARKQEEYNNIDLLRQVSVRIKEEGIPKGDKIYFISFHSDIAKYSE